MLQTIGNIEEYNSFEFKEGQKFQVVNAHFEIKKINDVLWVVDPENYGSEVQQKGQADSLKTAIQSNFKIQQLA
jgi:hypothetical protein